MKHEVVVSRMLELWMCTLVLGERPKAVLIGLVTRAD